MREDECLAQILKATYFFYVYLNPHPGAIEIATEVCHRSILEPGFNGKYAKIYKYCRQGLLGINWTPPDEFPTPLIDGKINDWFKLKDFLRGHQPGTPEVLIPGELLFPWEDDLPSDIEYLEGDYPGNKLDEGIIEEIVDSLLSDPRMIPTTTDFIVSQTNCKRIHSASTSLELEKKGRDAMGYKYSTVTKWVDKGCKPQPAIAIRTPVWKRTTEYRDAISLNPGTLFAVWELNSYLKYMINHKGVGDYTDMAELKQFYHKHSSFLLTDWRKSGLTLPHWFCKIVVRCVQKKAPTYSGQFPVDGIKIWDSKKQKWFYNEDFGYGLGMVNNVYTLFNIVLFEYAKRKEIFSEKDEIKSFNDDSVIGCKQTSYNRWLGICRDSGGYVDVHKSVQSDCIQFCEMHQGKKFINSFKWLSCFHTIYSTLSKSRNHTQWRFVTTQSWDAVRGYQSQLIPRKFSNEEIMGNIVDITLMGADAYWGKESINGVHPEFGGVGLGVYFRTTYNLKDTLLELEKKTGKEFFHCAASLRVCKESLNSTKYPKYRPWQQFPEGKTKQYMELIGSLDGLNHELKSLLDKTQNKFILENDWFQDRYWSDLENKLSKLDKDNPTIFDVEGYMAAQHWDSYAVPKFLVSSEVEISHDVRELPFARMAKEKPKYSLIKMLEELYLYFSTGSPVGISMEELGLDKYIQWETPVYPNSNCYNPICDMELISKISDFNDPRRVFLDYWAREHSVITGLRTKERRAKAAAEFLARSTGLTTLASGFATWYTKFPLPYNDELKEILSHHLPILHEEIIHNWFESREEGYIPLDKISFDVLHDHAELNPTFWKKNTKKKKKQEKKARPSKIVTDENAEQQHISLTTLNMDDTLMLLEDFIQRAHSVPIEVEELEEKGQEPSISYYDPEVTPFVFEERPDWLTAPQEESSEEEYEDQSDDEDEMIRAALDLQQRGKGWDTPLLDE
jgi:hypothetical protein